MYDWYSAFLFVDSFDVEECPNCECDSFSTGRMFFNRLRMTSGTCGRYSPDFLNYRRRFLGTRPVWMTIGQNVYLRFKTDDSIHFNGINISFTVESRRCKLLLRSYCF